MEQKVTYRYLPHTADVRIEIEASSLEELLADSVAVVRELVVGASQVQDRRTIQVSLTATDVGDLVWKLIRMVLDQFNTEAFVPARLEIAAVTPVRLRGTLHGEPADAARHAAQPEVKALTRHDFLVEQTPPGWRAELLFDV
ncbi:MAG: archease [Gemmatimonadetes bacterium]|nr:archease [Gemmatimonadota bacterium]